MTAALAPLPKIITGLPAGMDRDACRKAHEYAADYHSAMERIIIAEHELSDPDIDAYGYSYWRKEYFDAVVKCGDALEKMPAVWAALMTIQITA